MDCEYLLAWFITQATTPALVLTAAENVSDQPIPAEQRGRQSGRRLATCSRCGLLPLRVGRRLPPLGLLGVSQTGLNQWPAPADPVAVTAVDKLVCAARKPSCGSILTRRQPGNEFRDVE